ncbi:protein RICE SALT SENSITIVE 3-like isoform X2 [Phragmites australis]|uniref:protein RICE SALT SENSITIVE 3-like isoform X2 n=1 Tax=Phragmites australis TaxID=29695 RepID=UPI002D78D9CA|nr:protein RICE SALT SENSITIVE 3-like isoform X2 [Phragmites australis]
MEEQLNPLAVTHLLQHTLRSLCTHDGSQWVYAVFWRILPRNYPPPKWDLQGGLYDRTRGNRRNWILAWEDGFCNFAASACDHEDAAAAAYTECAAGQEVKGLQPELFFKMSHDIYNYGEGLIGKVAADHSHKWVFQEAQEHEINLISSWSNPADSHPRAWEAQFQSGIKTIALVAVREGVVQLGSMKKVVEDLSYVVMLRRKFGYLESIPGVLLPHPSSAAFPAGGCVGGPADAACSWPPGLVPSMELFDPYGQAAAAAAQMHIVPSMSSLETLLSKLPSVDLAAAGAGGMAMVAKEEVDAAHHAECHGMDDAAAGSGIVGHGGESTSVAAAAATTSPVSYYFNVAEPSEDF